MSRELLAMALDALDDPSTFRKTFNARAALRAALAAPEPEPVALESVHLTRDTRGMCVVRVNGRVAIRDNGDIIDHMATLEWFAAPPAAPAPAMREPLTDEQLARIAVEDEFLLYCDQDSFNEIARAIEAAHGITGASK